MRILICSDIMNTCGMTTVLQNTIACLKKQGHEVLHITADDFWKLPNPIYKNIVDICFYPKPETVKKINAFKPDHIHISQEYGVGLYMRRYCRKRKLSFTSAYHTHLPSYVPSYVGELINPKTIYSYMRWFHKLAKKVFVPTKAMRDDLIANNFTNEFVVWPGGVDTELFRPLTKTKNQKPVAIFVGRIAKEKNIEAFLNTKVDCHKIVVGTGPHLEHLKNHYPEVEFCGEQKGQKLVAIYNRADIFVFPSKTDTFGLVMLEALACGVPVAAYPILGPTNIITTEKIGCLDDDLDKAIRVALETSDPEACRKHALKFSWESITKQFLDNLVNTTPENEEQIIKPALSA